MPARGSIDIRREEARAFLRECRFRFAAGREGGDALCYEGAEDRYAGLIDDQLDRWRATLRLVPALAPEERLLELGGAPFFMSALVARFCGGRLEVVTYFLPEGAASPLTIEHVRSGSRYVIPFHCVNVEKDSLPYPRDDFRLVLCCEILEHLILNPFHMLAEVHRVLEPHGILVLTTPNVMRARNILKLVRGENVYDPYFSESVYARHTREYTPHEVGELLEKRGFKVTTLRSERVFRRRETIWGALMDRGVRMACGLMDWRARRREGRGPRLSAPLREDLIFAVAERGDSAGRWETPSFLLKGDYERFLRQWSRFPSRL